jgi:hypothetical protein
MLRLNTRDRVKSSLAQIKSMVARIVFGSRKAEPDLEPSMLVLLFVINNGVDDVVSFNWRSGNERGR